MIVRTREAGNEVGNSGLFRVIWLGKSFWQVWRRGWRANWSVCICACVCQAGQGETGAWLGQATPEGSSLEYIITFSR